MCFVGSIKLYKSIITDYPYLKKHCTLQYHAATTTPTASTRCSYTFNSHILNILQLFRLCFYYFIYNLHKYKKNNEKEGEFHSEQLIFVYGTLKRNEPNQDLVADSSKGKATFFGMARTIQKFPLVIASRFNIPFLLQKEGVGKNVIGELYKVDENMLERMDALEGNGKYYNRTKVEVQTLPPDDGDHVVSVLKPWVYLFINFREHLLDLPYLENYSSEGSHGLKFVSRHNRPHAEAYAYEVQNEKEGEPLAQHLIFVYGTLKRNEPNHDLVTDCSKGRAIFVGMGRTVQKFPLIIASRYNIPFLLHKEGVGKHVIGELYKIDDNMLETMDELENNGKYYNRIEVEVQRFIPDDEDRALPIVKAWVYLLPSFREHLLDLPYIENYSSKGPHGLEYVCSEDTTDPEQIYE